MQLRGVRPFFSDKFDITKHGRYKELSDYDQKNTFDIEDYVKHLQHMKITPDTEVADAFAELYEIENIVVLDVGRYGFVELKYYKPPHGFEDAITFTDSVALFEDLWEEWLNTKLYLMAKGTPLLEKGYKGVFESLSEEKQSELIVRKADFAKTAEIYL